MNSTRKDSLNISLESNFQVKYDSIRKHPFWKEFQKAVSNDSTFLENGL